MHRFTGDARTLADCVIRTYERFRPDAVCVSADTWVSAQAMGARVGPLTEDQPWGGLGEPFVQTAADLRRIPPPDPEKQGRYPLLLEALPRVVAALGRDVAVVACFDQYPFSLAAALMGINQIMLALNDESDTRLSIGHEICERIGSYAAMEQEMFYQESLVGCLLKNYHLLKPLLPVLIYMDWRAKLPALNLA